MELIIMQLLVSIAQMAVYGAYLREALGFRRPMWQLPLWWVVFEAVDWAAVNISGLPWSNAIVYLLGLEAIAFWMCRGRRAKKAFLVLAFGAVIIVVEAICVNSIILLSICDEKSMMENAMISYSVLLLNQMFVFGLTQVALYLWKKHVADEIDGKNWIGLFGMCGGCFIATAIVGTNMISYRMFSMGQILVLLILVVLNFLSYYFYTVSAERNRAMEEARMYEKQVSMYQEWYESIRANNQELQTFRHDIRNHLNTLRSLCRKAEEEQEAGRSLAEIRKYIDEINVDYMGISELMDSGNPVLDAIISVKKSYAQAKGIQIETKIQVPEKMQLDGADTVILLGNLLDNAIEACERTSAGICPEIELMIRYEVRNLIITLRNTYNGALDGRSSEEGMLIETNKTNKKQHGIGMNSILRIIEKYNGTMTWKAEQGVFMVSVLLYGFDIK